MRIGGDGLKPVPYGLNEGPVPYWVGLKPVRYGLS
jgi:hypothetical protein